MHMAMNQTGACIQVSVCREKSVSAGLLMFLYVISGIVVLLTVCGNLLIIISVCHFKQLHTPTNMLILSLAVSDCLVGVFVMPFHFMWLIETCWNFDSVFCVVFNLVSAHLTAVSVQNVALISVDRFIALSYPFLYAKKISLNVAYCVVLFTWLALLLYSSALVYFNRNHADHEMCPGQCLFTLDEVCSLIDLILLFILPCAVMIMLYSQILFIVKRHSNAIHKLHGRRNANHSNTMNSMRSERKAAKVFGILVVIFLLCLVPYYVCSILIAGINTEMINTIMKNMLTLFYLNSTINPVIYALFYPWFRRSVSIILTCRILYTDSSLINVLSSSRNAVVSK
ncbi:trace amine-associated receptor 13c-like [Electrophorus electricus]|uniref:trace amine-associated receptor 13c-like n=1 Tax=Electrophorus electricus TaxID=8005 RepID=UPI0015D0C985|nr:trace amine-associated receptor 13c-like [Electrophorus electricus]